MVDGNEYRILLQRNCRELFPDIVQSITDQRFFANGQLYFIYPGNFTMNAEQLNGNHYNYYPAETTVVTILLAVFFQQPTGFFVKQPELRYGLPLRHALGVITFLIIHDVAEFLVGLFSFLLK